VPGQRAALLDVMVIKQKSRRNGVTAFFDSWITAAYKKKWLTR
jgi:hypothetical protein